MQKRSSSRSRILQTIVQPIEAFIHAETSGGLLLLACAAFALLWANSPFADGYVHFWETSLSFGFGSAGVAKSLHHWINDGLMVLFFFVVGLEIKRELLVGELSSVRKAVLPALAALGGMLVPAFFYAIFNAGREGANGWGIPMATDIAFALGVLALMGKRIPLSLKVFLAALAIADDLGAVLVIAIFYTSSLNMGMLGLAALFAVLAFVGNSLGVRGILFYLVIGVCLWWCVMQSGIHATIAGVVLALAIPAKQRINAHDFTHEVEVLIQEFARQTHEQTSVLANQAAQSAVKQLEIACEEVQTPLSRFETNLHTTVAFVIMPLFAIANAGVSIEGASLWDALVSAPSLGITLGLFLGKPLGIMLFSWIACKARIAALPDGIRWREMFGVACLGGIGFTMSLFVESLAFPGSPILSTDAKIGIFCGSILSGIVGFILLQTFMRKDLNTTT